MHDALFGTLMLHRTADGEPVPGDIALHQRAGAAQWETCTLFCLDIVSAEGRVGECKITRASELRCGWISYVIHPPHRGQRFATLAVQAILDAARRMSLVRIKAHVNAANEASMRVLLRNGFTRWRSAQPPDLNHTVWARWI